MNTLNDEIRFGEYRISGHAQTLLREDQVVHITPKSFGLLLHFIEQAGRLVTREELFARHWPEQVVTDYALTRCIREIRTALQDDAQRPRFLTTVHRRGYRFVALSYANPIASETDLNHRGEPLFGRQAEVEDGLIFVRRGLRQNTGVILEISGEPGIGKSRVALTLMERLRAERFVCAHARAAETGGAPPFWLWKQVLRSLQSESRLTSFAAEVGATLAELDRTTYPVDLGAALQRDRDRAAFRARDVVVQLLLRLSNFSSVVILLEDIHAAEPDCLRLLSELAQATKTSALAVILTYRDVGAPTNDALKACLTELARAALPLRRVALRGLEQQAVQSWLRVELGDEPDHELVGLALRKTGGNPLYLRELAALPSSDMHETRPYSWALDHAETLSQLITRRLQLMDQQSRDVLALAAVMGLDFSEDLLRRCWFESDVDLELALRRARAERLIQPVRGSRPRWRFSHGLLQEVIYEQLAFAARAQLHERIATALEAVGPELGYAQIAFHYGRAAPNAQQAHKVAVFLRLAALQAFGSYAYGESLRHCEELVRHLERCLPKQIVDLSEALVGLAVAMARCGRPDEARAQAQRALTLGRGSGDAAVLARAALAWCVLQPSYPPQPQCIDLLTDVLNATNEHSADMRARLLAQRAFHHFVRGDMDALGHDGRQALLFARSSKDAGALDAALSVISYGFVHPRDDEERRQVYNERFLLARQRNDVVSEYEAQLSRLEHVLQVATAETEIHSEVARLEAMVVKIATPNGHAALSRVRAGIAIAQGDHELALQLAQQALQQGQSTTDTATAYAISLLQLGTIFNLRGQIGEMRADLEEDADITANSLLRVAPILVRCRLNDFEGAAGQMKRILDRNVDLAADMTYGLALSNLALSCSMLKDRRGAEQLIERLLPFRRRNLTALCYFSGGCASLALAMLAAVLGRWRDCEELLEEALMVNARLGFSLHYIDTAVAYVGISSRLGGAQRLRATALEDEVGAFLDRTGLQRSNLTCASMIW